MTKYENKRKIDKIRNNKEWEKAERITVKLCPNYTQIDRNLIERIKELNTFTNDITFKNIRKIIDKTIYIINEIIDIVRLLYVSIKINQIKDKK